MKKIVIIISFCLIGALMLIGLEIKPKENVEYLRIHIRADSNSELDQNIKYKIKDKIVEYLTPYISECDTKQKAQEMLEDNLKNIESIADKCLKENGFEYTSNAYINNELFPLRVYEDLTLESGFYDALIVNLGSGKGDNWWCVVYPPLCFVGEGTSVIYKSKIVEIIKNFFN